MSKVLYFLLTFVESVAAVFGIRSPLEQPPYRVVASYAHDVEVRAYGPLAVVETSMEGSEGDAFRRLFSYITGANAAGATIKMTAPSSASPARSRGATSRRTSPPCVRR